MLAVATAFKGNMDRIVAFVELNVALFDLAKVGVGRFRSRHAIAASVRDVHSRARAIPLGLSLACEGAYLCACAQFEQCVRDLIDEAAIQSVAKKGTFALLPDTMQDEHTKRCGKILQNINQDKYSHLGAASVVAALHGCVVTGASPAALVVEAFSSNERNFKPGIVSEHLGKLGVSRVWELLGQQACLQAHFRTISAPDAERFARQRLERIMDTRNTIIHRGRGFVPPSDSEAMECATFFVALSEALARVLCDYAARI